MKIEILESTKYAVKSTTGFNKDLRKVFKQGKNIQKLTDIVKRLANGEQLEERYKNHNLVNNKKYQDCSECHIEPDWLLVYKYVNNELILLLVSTGSHSELFN